MFVVSTHKFLATVTINGATFYFAIDTKGANENCGMGKEVEYANALRRRFTGVLTPADLM